VAQACGLAWGVALIAAGALLLAACAQRVRWD
jgi:hypothetical protein